MSALGATVKDPCGGAAVRGQLAYISSSEECCKCVIIPELV